jgi:hypothetical protein
LLPLAWEQKAEGKSDVGEFVMTRQPKVIVHIIKTTWDMCNAKDDNLQRSKKTCMQL